MKTRKVYRFQLAGEYRGGVMLVVSDSAEQAKAFALVHYHGYGWDYVGECPDLAYSGPKTGTFQYLEYSYIE